MDSIVFFLTNCWIHRYDLDDSTFTDKVHEFDEFDLILNVKKF